ncbi:MAG TPA: methyltransferase domain-containing protein [Pyrinomonadaceae bacterium]|nr:methyltransferase domain-containing protein [Pyrinomonadaceae bacterium]
MKHAALLACLFALALSTAGAGRSPQGADAPSGQKRGRQRVPYVTTPPEVVEEMLKVARVTKTDVVYDLGCGDGRIVIAAARKYGARGVGIDINPERVREARENARRAGVADRVKFFQQDLFESDIREATVVTLFLMTTVNLELRPKLLRELKPGTRVVSHAFDMGDWKPRRTVEVNRNGAWGTVYFWTIPEATPARD